MDTLSRGDGALFSDPSAKRARQTFAAKPRALTDKLTTVADAVYCRVENRVISSAAMTTAKNTPIAMRHRSRSTKRNCVKLIWSVRS